MAELLSIHDFPLPKNLRDSAVLVPVFRDAAGEVQVVMVRRTAFGVHGGQLAFPGGKPEPIDADLRATALREAFEEVHLPPAQVQLLAALPTVPVPSGFRISPFLGRIQRPTRWQWQAREVDEVLEIPLRHLADEFNHTEETWELPGWPGPPPRTFLPRRGRLPALGRQLPHHPAPDSTPSGWGMGGVS